MREKVIAPKFIQIITAQWDGNTGLNYTLYALDDQGGVYRRDKRSGPWVKLLDQIVSEGDE